MSHQFALAALVSLYALAGSSQALAAASSSASLSNLTIRLVDLDPTDGVAASITFNELTYYAYGSFVSAGASYYDASTGLGVGDGNSAYSPTTAPFASNAVSGTVTNTTASASIVGGESVLGPHALSSAGSALGANSPGSYSNYSASAYVPNYYYYSNNSFTLSANTLVIFSATATLQASTTVGYNAVDGQSESATAAYSMSVSGTNGDGTGSQSGSSGLTLSASYIGTFVTDDPLTGAGHYTYSGDSQSFSRKVSVSFANASDNSLTGYFNAQTSVSGGSNVSAVPEASTLSLALSGLGCAVLMRRRPAARRS